MNIDNIQFNRSAVSPLDCVSKGWEIVKPNYVMFLAIGFGVLILGCIPVVSWFLIGPILVGIYGALLKQYRGEQSDFGTIFSGFSQFVPALVIGILLILPGILLNTYNLGLRIAQALAIFDASGLTGSAATIFTIVGFLINVIALVGSIIFGITFTFALPLLADKNLSLMETIKLSAKSGWANFGGLFLLFLLCGVMLIGGFLALCLGILFVLPIIYAAIIAAYRQVFPDSNNQGQQNFPATPDNYGNMAGQQF
jgi:uncharacterized membrane protein